MEKKTLILHIPVIHKGFLDFFKSRKNDVGQVYMIDSSLLEELAQFKLDIASLEPQEVRQFLGVFGLSEIKVLTKENIGELSGKDLILVNDELSRNLVKSYLKNECVEWVSVFLRWDKSSIVANLPLENIASSDEVFDIQMMQEAYEEAKKSGDWWRQVGAIIVKDGNVVARACNQGVPSDHTPYQVGMVRDFFKAGERQEFSNTTHAEPRIIGEAARKGIGLEGTSLYVTHFPCAVCAKFVAYSGIKRVYFREGASTLDGRAVMESADIALIRVPKLD